MEYKIVLNIGFENSRILSGNQLLK